MDYHATLLLSLAGELFQVSLEGNVIRLLRLQGKRQGACYEVTREGAGGSCTCPDCLFRARRCKHIAALREVGLLPAVEKVKEAATP